MMEELKEIWKDIKGYEGLYQVSNKGRVKSLPNNCHREEKILRQVVLNSGYYRVLLSKNKKKTNCLVHRLVAEAFLPNPDNLPQVGHRDENNLKTGDECNNCVENLYWTTAKDNCNEPKQKQKLSESLKGKESYWKGKHQPEEVKKKLGKAVMCIETGMVYYGIHEAHRQTGIDRDTIGKCCRGILRTAGKYHWKYYDYED